MKIVMISNYMNHHQISFCDRMSSLTNGNFWFIATRPAGEFRIKLGYKQMDRSRDYIVASYSGEEEYRHAMDLCENADVLIIGHTGSSFKVPRKQGQLVFFNSERLFKNRKTFWKNAGRFIKYALKHNGFRNCYLLCASSYAAKDYHATGNFTKRSLKWGYFPKTVYYSEEEIRRNKNNDIPMILWVGRLIDWKHPDLAIETAVSLRSKGLQFRMEIIGSGDLEPDIRSLVSAKGLSDIVSVLGSIPSDDVRKHMENANIFLFTSDENEGWGAVVNEAMNSACAVIGTVEAGSVPYLIDDQSGRTFHCLNKQELFDITEELVRDKELTLRLGLSGYRKITTEWNGLCAAERLVQFAQSVYDNSTITFPDGPCSTA